MFFSVKTSMKIGGKKYRSCICYPITDHIKLTVEKLAEEGKADIYTEQRFFCNGKLVPLKKKESKKSKTDKKAEREVSENTEKTEIKAEGF